MDKITQWIVKNWDKIPDNFKQDIRNKYGWTDYQKNNLNGLPDEDHIVVLLVDRQKPSVEADYSFNEERIGVTKSGKIIWGFDSGCSCPSPWDDSYPECYEVSEGWKQFTLNAKGFDEDWLKECEEQFAKIKEKTNE